MDRTQHDLLTPRQREVLRLVERGHTNGEIAEMLGISLQGVKWHVRELLGKLGAESREELIERRRALVNWPNPGRWVRGIAAAGILKVAAAASSVVVAGIALGTIVIALNGGSTPAEESKPQTAVAVLTPAPMPSVTGSIWTPEEALRHARQEVGADIGVSSYDAEFAQPINLDTYVVTQFEWLPDTARYDRPDGDRYWAAEDGKPRDLWLLRYQGRAFDENPHSNQPVNVSVVALVEDGATAKVVKALSVDVTDASGRPLGGGGGSFRMRSMDARMAAMVSPSGPKRIVAHRNGWDEGPALIVFEAQAGGWCLLARDLICGFDPARPSFPLVFDVASGYSADLGRLATEVVVQADARVARIEVLPGDGRSLVLDLVDPPEGMPQQTRYAYLELGPSLPADHIVIVAFDAGGKELGRRTGPGLVQP